MSDTTSPLSSVRQVDNESRAVFEAIKHDVLHKIWELHKGDDLHDLNEARKLEHVKFYRPLAYKLQEVPYGVNYFAKIVLDEQGHAIHARAFKPSEESEKVVFHAIHVRPSDQGGAVFTLDDEIQYFEY
ncbi:hypothetical protein SISNIDRAFT_153308 [Sistotremastrum niveocremeum HHB9708]|uniref:Cystatin domain-containing protein n=1 Tax=Sistotremastrum niveocremeum HHB9708 TaxID=1314777 RepID=A0A165A7K2_9AGAM|nr:hypothetical protein SISNIDRAFT_153308 [Sistotremastrum niveocremeum HHB9708]